MYIREIEYKNYKGEMEKDECCFALNRAELFKWMTTTGNYTLDKVLERIVKEKNGQKIIEIFEGLMHSSYGTVSLDGKRFEKSEEAWVAFTQTEAYSIMFMDLVTDGKKAAEFVNGIIPEDLAEEVAKAIKENSKGIPVEIRDYLPQNK